MSQNENESAMSETNATSYVPNEMLVEYLPEELTLNPKFDIRGDTAIDESSDAELRESIKAHGQQQPIKIRRVDDGMEVVFGHRRYNAVTQLNIERDADAEPLKLKCVLVDMTDEQALQAAWDENAKRRNMTPIVEAKLIVSLRGEFGWKGTKGTQKVAKFMGKSPAWVSEREKLLTLDESMQGKVQSGELSAEAALMLPGVKPELRGKVIAEAQDRQAAEDSSKEATTGKSNGKGKGKANGANGTGKPAKRKPVSARHVAAAIRNNPEASVDPSKTKALKAKDLVGFFASYVGGIPFLYEPVQDFLSYFVNKFAMGKGTDETMEKKFEAMIAPACKGAKMEAPVEAVKVVKDKVVKPAKPSKADKTAKAVAALKAEAAKKKAGKKSGKSGKSSK